MKCLSSIILLVSSKTKNTPAFAGNALAIHGSIPLNIYLKLIYFKIESVDPSLGFFILSVYNLDLTVSKGYIESQ